MSETQAHPAPLPFISGKFQFSPAEAFAEIARDFRLRLPAGGTEGLLGPFRSVGYCLEPLGHPGDVRWFDSQLPAQHGDLVLVELGEEVLAGIVKRQRHDPQWLATYGENPSPLACKILYALGADWWLLTNDSAFPLEGNRILGTCRRIERDGQSQCATTLVQIAPGAATEIASDAPADGTWTTGAISAAPGFQSSTDIASCDWTNSTGASVTAEITYSIIAKQTASDASIFYRVRGSYSLSGGGGTTTENWLLVPYASASDDYSARSGNFTVTVANGQTLTANIDLGLIVPTGISATPPGVTFKDARLRITAIKR